MRKEKKKKNRQITTVNKFNVVIWQKIQKFLKSAPNLRALSQQRANRKRGNQNFRQDFPSKRSGLLISFRNLRRTEQTYNISQKIKIDISFLVKITMAEEKILENHNVNTMEHEMKTQGYHLKEIKKKYLNESAHMLIIFRNSLILFTIGILSKILTDFQINRNFLKIINLLYRLDKKTINVHVRTIKDDRHRVRSFKARPYLYRTILTIKFIRQIIDLLLLFMVKKKLQLNLPVLFIFKSFFVLVEFLAIKKVLVNLMGNKL